jgi:hypothetical protein
MNTKSIVTMVVVALVVVWASNNISFLKSIVG